MMRAALLSICWLPALATATLGDEPPPTVSTEATVPAATGASRTVAIGDVHGDFRRFALVLRAVGLTDEAGRWAGGDASFVQTGDLLDRGPDSRRALELVMRLEDEAPRTGGKVTVLLGNHEVMNLAGDMRYVSAGEFAAFAADETAELRASRRQAMLDLLANPSKDAASKYHAELRAYVTARGFDAVYPAGYFAHRRAFSRKGRYGAWLLERPVAHVEKDTLFVHAGVSPRYARSSPEDWTRAVHEGLKEYDDILTELERRRVFDRDFGFGELHQLILQERAAPEPSKELAPLFERVDRLLAGPVFGQDSPLWYRGLAEEDETLFRVAVDEILEAQKVGRIVIGHTQDPTLRIRTRFASRIVLIDTGMNREFYGGRPSAFEIKGDGRTVIWE